MRTDQNDTIECKIKGRFFKKSKFNHQVAVGDRVHFTKADIDTVGLIDRIDPRRSFLSRSRVGIEAEQVIAANIDRLIIVVSSISPAFRPNLINRMLVASEIGNLTPILVLTKTDLSTPAKISQQLHLYKTLPIEIFRTSTVTAIDTTALKNVFMNNISVLAGPSGAGKSSLLNMLFPGLDLKVGAVSSKNQKGAHTTTYAAMHEIAPESFVIDTPGIREYSLWNLTKQNLLEYFPLIKDYQGMCKHNDCVHVHEPHCEVKQAVKAGKIYPELYDSYVSIYDSLEASKRKY